MKIINNKPINVDFNNRDEDGAVRLHLPITTVDLKEIDLPLIEEEKIWISDGEIEEIGNLKFRDGIWVVIPLEGTLKDVDKKADYYIENVKKK